MKTAFTPVGSAFIHFNGLEKYAKIIHLTEKARYSLFLETKLLDLASFLVNTLFEYSL
jgi:hypothetical protein